MKVLHLVGSQTSEYYYNVSVIYAPGCINAFPELEHMILLAHLDGSWSLPKTLDEKDVELANKFKSLPEALVQLQDNKPDIVQPHMFCYRGMTLFRSVADLLDVPILGNPGHVMALTTNKWQSRAVMGSVGVPVPKGILVEQGISHEDLLQQISLPFLLKPAREDNSMGITLVQEESQLEAALQTAFAFDDLVLAESFIPLGREIRVGVVEKDDGSLEMLPCMEYFLHKKALPIRTSADKLTQSTDGDGDKETLTLAPVDRACPAIVDPVLEKKMYEMACKAHNALECQHYSLYDVRVDPDGNPFFIEASPYCSFSPKSAIVTMSVGDGSEKFYNNKDLFYRLARKAIRDFRPAVSVSRGTEAGGAKQKLGMRRRNSPTSATVTPTN